MIGESASKVLSHVADSLVYVVDDDPVSRSAVAALLSAAGYRVGCSTSADAHAQITSLGEPRLIVLGELSRARSWARRDDPSFDALAHVPTLAIGDDDLQADAVLARPFEARGLRQAVELTLMLATVRQTHPEVSVVDVGAVLEASLRHAEERLEARAEVVLEFDRQLRVRANPEQLCLIFLNLLLAAANRIGTDAPRMNGIRVAGWRTAHERTIVEISDTGRGISAAEQEQLFAPLVADARDREPGLDLAESACILRAGGGDITMRSGKGGSSFRVELPSFVG